MVSVCIATYNGEKYIREQLFSIITQLSDNDEIIISDDLSTDNTINIIKSFNDSRIKIYTNKKVNHHFLIDYSTHNFENAIKNAKGDYIFLADQDDVWLPDKYNIILDSLKSSDIVVTNCKVTDSKLNVIQESYFNYAHVGKGFWKNLYSNTHLGCCMAFDRKILSKLLPFPQSGVGHDFWIAVFGGLFYSVLYIDRPFLLYRKHDNNVTPSGLKSKNSILFKLHYRFLIIYNVIIRIIKLCVSR